MRESDKGIVTAYVDAFQAFGDQHVVADDAQYHLYRHAGAATPQKLHGAVDTGGVAAGAAAVQKKKK